MTGHELLASLQDLSDDQLNLEVVFYNEYFLDDFKSVEIISATSEYGYLDESDSPLDQKYIYLKDSF